MCNNIWAWGSHTPQSLNHEDSKTILERLKSSKCSKSKLGIDGNCGEEWIWWYLLSNQVVHSMYHFVPQDPLRVLNRWLAYYMNLCQLGKSTLDSIDDYSGKMCVPIRLQSGSTIVLICPMCTWWHEFWVAENPFQKLPRCPRSNAHCLQNGNGALLCKKQKKLKTNQETKGQDENESENLQPRNCFSYICNTYHPYT